MLKRSDNMSLKNELRLGIEQLGLSVSSETQIRLLDYLNLLVKWNKVYNLTAIRDPGQMVIHHLLDSLAVMPYMKSGKWLDVGSGAGLPGLVVAIAQPDWSITLLDSNSKKTGFMQQAVIEMNLTNVQVCCTRVEEFRTAVKFDGIISRAFTELGDFLRITRHLIADNGRWLAMKGLPEQELAGVKADCKIENVIPLSVPGLKAARCLVIAIPLKEQSA